MVPAPLMVSLGSFPLLSHTQDREIFLFITDSQLLCPHSTGACPLSISLHFYLGPTFTPCGGSLGSGRVAVVDRKPAPSASLILLLPFIPHCQVRRPPQTSFHWVPRKNLVMRERATTLAAVIITTMRKIRSPVGTDLCAAEV